MLCLASRGFSALVMVWVPLRAYVGREYRRGIQQDGAAFSGQDGVVDRAQEASERKEATSQSVSACMRRARVLITSGEHPVVGYHDINGQVAC